MVHKFFLTTISLCVFVCVYAVVFVWLVITCFCLCLGGWFVNKSKSALKPRFFSKILDLLSERYTYTPLKDFRKCAIWPRHWVSDSTRKLNVTIIDLWGRHFLFVTQPKGHNYRWLKCGHTNRYCTYMKTFVELQGTPVKDIPPSTPKKTFNKNRCF